MRNVAEIQADIAATENELATVRGRETEVYSRIVGYYRAVKNWNGGKREEYRHRKTFTVAGGAAPRPVPVCTAADAPAAGKAPAHRTAARQEAVTGRTGTRPARGGTPESLTWLLFTRPACPNCPPVRAWTHGLDLPGREVNTGTDEGMKAAREWEVISAPTAVFLDASGNEVFRGRSVAELESLLAGGR